MKISYNWLKQYININLPAEEIADLLTSCGLEVEGIHPFQSVKGGLEGLVIGEVKTCVKHPNADKLSLTTVDVGEENLLNIVCGAPNVQAGQKVIVAPPGTLIYPTTGEPFEIKKSKIRGEASEGMICAEDEIGLGSDHAGIIVLPSDAPVGKRVKEYYNVEEDVVFEIGLTPNRVDAASHIGVARDLLAVLRMRRSKVEIRGLRTSDSLMSTSLSIPAVDKFKPENHSLSIPVEVKNTDACPRYSAITISGVEVKESPSWLKNRLLAIGLNPINNIVDITNYVLHEYGQPLHAFDADKIAGKKVIVRTAHPAEKFVTLDGVERKLSEHDLMICNAEEPMCIAGVFGGLHSGIAAQTKNVFLESANFNPQYIRKTAKRHGLHTDASFRFERGADPEATLYALKRAAMLIREIAGGKISSEIVDIYPRHIEPKRVEYNFRSAATFIGKDIDHSDIKGILSSLNIQIISETPDNLFLNIPTYKVDVTRQEDVVEEILRIYGYNNIEEPAKLNASLSYFPKKDPEKLQNRISDYLSSNGFFEILTNSLSSKKYATENHVEILNPLSQDLSVMRQSMLHGGLQSIEYNRNRKNHDLKFFEFGTTYSIGKKGYDEQQHLVLFLTGKKFDTTWTGDKSDVNFFYLKSFVSNILQSAGITDLKESSIENEIFHYGLTLSRNEKPVVSFGSVRKSQLKNFDIDDEVFYADFNWQLIVRYNNAGNVQYKEVSKFPQVKRDLSMMISKEVQYSDIEKIAYATERDLLKDINLFDVYEGDKIEAGKKSYAVSFLLQDERQTLTDKQIDKIMDRLMQAFEKQAGAVIRKG